MWKRCGLISLIKVYLGEWPLIENLLSNGNNAEHKSVMKLVFVTGKGGVGKTTFASAQALNLASRGQKVLLVEFGPKSQLQYIFDISKLAKIKYKRLRVPASMEVVMWNFEEVLVEFITYYLKIKTLVKSFFSSPIMKKLIKVAPSLRELVYLGKATSAYRKIGKDMNYDTIIIDAYSTGHFLALMRSPVGMMKAVKKGPMNSQCKTILEVLKNPNLVDYYVVSLAEQLPIEETIEFVDVLKEEFKIQPKIIFNKVKEPLSKEADQSCIFQSYYNKSTINQDQQIKKLKKYNINLNIPFIYENKITKIVDEVQAQIGIK